MFIKTQQFSNEIGIAHENWMETRYALLDSEDKQITFTINRTHYLTTH